MALDLSFLTGNQQQQPGMYSWLAGANQNQGMNFNTPAMNYQPGAAIGMATQPQQQTLAGAGGLTNQLGLNLPTFQLGLGALNTVGNLYGAFSANNLAKDQFKFAKNITNTNLNNQIQSYNTALEDRARSRATAENRDQSTADEYINKNKLSR